MCLERLLLLLLLLIYLLLLVLLLFVLVEVEVVALVAGARHGLRLPVLLMTRCCAA